MMVTALLAFAALAVAAAMTRIWAANQLDCAAFPFGTLLVNIAGSLALGALVESAPTVVTVVGVGGLGSLTTYSSLTRETIRRCANKLWWSGGLYLLTSVLCGVAAAWLGIQLVSG